LEASLAGLSESALDLVRDKNKWTIREIAHHIIDSDIEQIQETKQVHGL
jgi:hypothetical protein